MARFDRPISAFIIAKNEAAVLGECLDSLDLCAEIVVVDSGSTDGTLDLVARYQANGFPIRLIHNDWPGFARQKQFALEACAQPWCLNVDCDERLDGDLRDWMATADLSAGAPVAYDIPRRDYLAGYGYPPKSVHAQRIVRLVRKGRARYDEHALVHESLLTDGAVAPTPKGALLHFRNLSIAQDAARADAYSTLKAEEKFARGRTTNLARLVFSPFGRFLKSYVAQRYFLCGTPGFIYAGMLAYYVFLTEAKLYRLSLGARTRTTTSA
ncbi:MAG: glycosyltransferase family 2 protein [Rhizobiaceae bacterium]|nr:glycosyltransferase family 2 protein [Rhizobiaceae bacterium]